MCRGQRLEKQDGRTGTREQGFDMSRFAIYFARARVCACVCVCARVRAPGVKLLLTPGLFEEVWQIHLCVSRCALDCCWAVHRPIGHPAHKLLLQIQRSKRWRGKCCEFGLNTSIGPINVAALGSAVSGGDELAALLGQQAGEGGSMGLLVEREVKVRATW
eukprot:1157649-Pelagomonas_calceolata.AAC.5